MLDFEQEDNLILRRMNLSDEPEDSIGETLIPEQLFENVIFWNIFCVQYKKTFKVPDWAESLNVAKKGVRSNGYGINSGSAGR